MRLGIIDNDTIHAVTEDDLERFDLKDDADRAVICGLILMTVDRIAREKARLQEWTRGGEKI